MSTESILLFGTMADLGQTVKYDLVGHGLEVYAVDFPQNVARDFSGYRREILKAVEKYAPSTIMPIGDSLALAKLREELPASISIPVDRADTIALLSSKVQTYALVESLGVQQPQRYSMDAMDDLLQDGAFQDRLVIFKRDISFGGSGVHLPQNFAALQNLVSHECGRPFLIEDYIEGEDLSVDCVRIKDYFRAECYVSTGRTYSQGPSEQRVKAECPEAVVIAQKILGYLDYQGVCGLDFRRKADGSLYILECNPRFTGGLRTQIASGFDIPYLLYSLWP